MAKRYGSSFVIVGLIWGQAVAQITDPTITSWRINQDGTTGSSSNAAIDALVSQVQADVQQVRFNDTDVYVNSTSVPSHDVGPFSDGNPTVPSDIDGLYRFFRTPPETSATPNEDVGLGPVGVFVNGVVMFNYFDAFSYEDEGVWNNNAIVVRADGFDSSHGHPAPLMMGPPPKKGATSLAEGYHHTHHGNHSDLHTHGEPEKSPAVPGSYHYHQQPPALRGQLGDDGTGHSPVLDWVFDSVPMYGPYAFANTNGVGGIVRMESSYRIRSITDRTTLPDGTNLPANLHGPTINATFPLGYFVEDFEYVDGLGHLDEL